MTHTPPHKPLELPDDLPEWAKKPIYPSTLFGGVRKEVWTAEEVGGLYLGWMMLSDGLTALRVLLHTPTDAEDPARADAINDASDWMDGADQWMKLVVDKAKEQLNSDRGEILMEIVANVAFLLESVGEHVNRLGHSPTE